MSRDLKRRLFRAGAAAASKVLNTNGLYYCPLCAKGFETEAIDSGELTLEHVPPKSRGGRGIILTCRKCNSTAGYMSDAHLARREKLNAFVETLIQKREGDGGMARLVVGDREVNASVHYDGKVTVLNVLSRHNDPAATHGFSEELRRRAESNERLEINLTAKERYHKRLVDVGNLRAAYLICTAAFGYSFAFAPALRGVRAQINEPTRDLLPPWSVRMTEQINRQRIAVSDAAGIVLVSYGSDCVMLPWPSRGEEGFREASAAAVVGKRVTYPSVEWEWPTFFAAVLD